MPSIFYILLSFWVDTWSKHISRVESVFCAWVYIWAKRILGEEMRGDGAWKGGRGRGGRESWRAEGAKGGIQFENCGKRAPEPLQ